MFSRSKKVQGLGQFFLLVKKIKIAKIQKGQSSKAQRYKNERKKKDVALCIRMHVHLLCKMQNYNVNKLIDGIFSTNDSINFILSRI